MGSDRGRPRFYVACDISNLWKSCKEEYGEDARVDFQLLSQMIPDMESGPVAQQLVAYIVTNPAQRHNALASILRSYGFRVLERFLRHEKAVKKPTRTDWDVGITIDAIDHINEYDTFVLVSGDGDFAQLLNYLKHRGKKTLVLTFPHAAARQLYDAADNLIQLTDSIVFGLDSDANTRDNKGNESRRKESNGNAAKAKKGSSS